MQDKLCVELARLKDLITRLNYDITVFTEMISQYLAKDMTTYNQFLSSSTHSLFQMSSKLILLSSSLETMSSIKSTFEKESLNVKGYIKELKNLVGSASENKILTTPFPYLDENIGNKVECISKVTEDFVSKLSLQITTGRLTSLQSTIRRLLEDVEKFHSYARDDDKTLSERCKKSILKIQAQIDSIDFTLKNDTLQDNANELSVCIQKEVDSIDDIDLNKGSKNFFGDVANRLESIKYQIDTACGPHGFFSSHTGSTKVSGSHNPGMSPSSPAVL